MLTFIYEFSYFLAASLAILVSISSFALFILTFRYERKLQTVWRALGFLFLAFSFILLILERKYPGIDVIAVLVMTFGLYSIYKGVKAEPVLVPLLKVAAPGKDNKVAPQETKTQLLDRKFLITILIALAIILLFLLPGYLYLSAFLPSILELAALIFIILTINIQIKRYQADKKAINLYPLVGYIFLAIRGLMMVFYRLPDLNIVFLRMASLEYSTAWLIAIIGTFLGFAYLGIWAWKFVKVRPFLRSYVVFISMVIIVSTIGALIFTLFIFKVVENNNLDLMRKGAETESVIMNDRANTALFVAQLAAEDQRIINAIENGSYNTLVEITDKYLDSSKVDILRIFNNSQNVIVSASDQRDRGVSFADDEMLEFVLIERKQIKTFDTQPGVLADRIYTRALYPIINDQNELIGVVEAGFRFDDAFVDFSKEKTGLDVTIYTGNKISATTILTQDNVSRYVGAEEVSNDILQTVLTGGQGYSTTIDRFGEIYYSAYIPIRNVDGNIIGMVSVGTPTYLLLESMRQQLLTTFIIVSLLSALISLLGYYLMPSLRIGAKKSGK